MGRPGFQLHHLGRDPLERPGPGERAPLLILLHGVGSNESDLLGLAPHLDRRFHLLSLRAPHRLAPGSFAWFEVEFLPQGPLINPAQAEESRRLLIEFLQAAPTYYALDSERIWLLGFSQGAIMSLALALTQPDLPAGVVAISGRTLPELFAEEGPLSGHLANPDALRDFPLMLVHGISDQVLSISYARDTRQRFSRYPVDLTYREYDMGHSISQESLADVSSWLSGRLDGPAVRSGKTSEQSGSKSRGPCGRHES